MNSDLASDVTFVTLLLLASALIWRAVRRALRGKRAENVLTVVAAIIATSVQADGMWVFFRDVLHAPVLLRIECFAFIEVAIFVSGLRARRNIKETGAAGVDGMAVWALAGLSAVLASTAADSFRSVLLRIAAPAVAAWLWERGLSGERRRARTKDKRDRRINWRITPERILVRLGIAEAADRTASEVDAHRRLTRTAVATQRLRTAPAGSWRAWLAERRQAAAVRRAVEYADLATDPDRQAALLAQIGALHNAQVLAQVRPPAPWAIPSGRPPLRLVSKQELERIEAGRARTRVPDDVLAPVPHELEPLIKKGRRKFRSEIESGQTPSIAKLKETLRIGQDRATAIQPYLAVPEGQREA